MYNLFGFKGKTTSDDRLATKEAILNRVNELKKIGMTPLEAARVRKLEARLPKSAEVLVEMSTRKNVNLLVGKQEMTGGYGHVNYNGSF